MYYHNTVRLIGLIAIGLLLWPSIGHARERPELVLKETIDRAWQLDKYADWRQERFFSGYGWELGTVSRGDGSVMQGGFTVVHPAKGNPFSWRHCYVLASFDTLPHGILLVTVRDPEFHWSGYDYTEGVVDPIEIVWFDDSWEEEDRMVLDFSATDYPDEFQLAPSGEVLLAIRHSVDDQGKLDKQGHQLDLVYLLDGEIRSLVLPEAGPGGLPPGEWWPVLMHFDDDGNLLVQAGAALRRYEVRWP